MQGDSKCLYGMVDHFLNNNTDEFISDCYTKIYYSLDGKGSIYIFVASPPRWIQYMEPPQRLNTH
jgi:hypothetical protein